MNSSNPGPDVPGAAAEWADVRRIGGLLGGAALSCILPQSLDPAWTAFLDRALRAMRAHQVRAVAIRMTAALGADAAFDAESAARDFWRMRLEDAWGRSRGVRRMGWRPQVRIVGLDRLERALLRGKGAILWGMRLASATAIKQALFFANQPLVHLSRAQHGSPTESRLGLGFAAPLYCRAENPYLLERVVIPLNDSPRYLQILRRRLAENKCLSVFGEHSGRRNVVRPVLNTRLSFAVGAPSLAWSEGGALLTVSAHREAPLAYRIEVDEEIAVDGAMPRGAFAEEAVAEFARRLESKIRRHPSDWQGWACEAYWRGEAGGIGDASSPG